MDRKSAVSAVALRSRHPLPVQVIAAQRHLGNRVTRRLIQRWSPGVALGFGSPEEAFLQYQTTPHLGHAFSGGLTRPELLRIMSGVQAAADNRALYDAWVDFYSGESIHRRLTSLMQQQPDRLLETPDFGGTAVRPGWDILHEDAQRIGSLFIHELMHTSQSGNEATMLAGEAYQYGVEYFFALWERGHRQAEIENAVGDPGNQLATYGAHSEVRTLLQRLFRAYALLMLLYDVRNHDREERDLDRLEMMQPARTRYPDFLASPVYHRIFGGSATGYAETKAERMATRFIAHDDVSGEIGDLLEWVGNAPRLFADTPFLAQIVRHAMTET